MAPHFPPPFTVGRGPMSNSGAVAGPSLAQRAEGGGGPLCGRWVPRHDHTHAPLLRLRMAGRRPLSARQAGGELHLRHLRIFARRHRARRRHADHRDERDERIPRAIARPHPGPQRPRGRSDVRRRLRLRRHHAAPAHGPGRDRRVPHRRRPGARQHRGRRPEARWCAA